MADDDAIALPRVRRILAELRFGPSADRMIERLHAESHKTIKRASHHNESFVSLAHRCPEIFKAIDDQPIMLHCIAKSMLEVSSPVLMVRSLGLHEHPSCQDARHKRDHIFQASVYSNDPFVKYVWEPPSVEVFKPTEFVQASVTETDQILGLRRKLMLHQLDVVLKRDDVRDAK